MKHSNPINPTHGLLRRMGGHPSISKKMFDLTGIMLTKQAVFWWAKREHIPKMWHLYLCMAYPQFAPEIQAYGAK